jgi:hypothetical protein
MGGKRGDGAKGTCSLTSLFSKQARVGQLQQQPIAVDTDLEKETSGVDADQGLALVYQLRRLRNRLDTCLEACLLLYMQDLFTTATFPYGELQEGLKSMQSDHRMRQTAERVEFFFDSF